MQLVESEYHGRPVAPGTITAITLGAITHYLER